MDIQFLIAMRRYAAALLLLWMPALIAAAPGMGGQGAVVSTPIGPAEAAEVDRGVLTAAALVAHVLKRNPGLSAMRAAAAAAQAAVYPAGALDDPMLSFQVPPQTIGAGGLTGEVQLSQSFPWPGTLHLRRQAAAALGESAAQQVEDTRLRLAAQARAAYAQWVYVHRAIAIHHRNQALLERLTAVAKAAYASGKAPQQDVLRAEVEAARLQNQALELKRRRRQVQARINGLLNREPDAPLPAPAGLAARMLPPFTHLRTAALSRYPQLKALDARIAAGRDEVALAHKRYYPNFTLSAGYNGLWSDARMRPMIGAAVNLPLDFTKRRARLDQADARLRQNRSRRADARAQLLSELRQTYVAATQARQTLHLYADRVLPLSRLDVQAAEADYSNGSGSFLDLITAQQRGLAAELEQAAAEATLFTQLANLDYQTGGTLFAAPAAAWGIQP